MIREDQDADYVGAYLVHLICKLDIGLNHTSQMWRHATHGYP